MKALVPLLLLASAGSAHAGDYGQLPAPTPFVAFPTSFGTGATVPVPPYGFLPVRIYTTPTQGPFYNVPPYRVVAPY